MQQLYIHRILSKSLERATVHREALHATRSMHGRLYSSLQTNACRLEAGISPSPDVLPALGLVGPNVGHPSLLWGPHSPKKALVMLHADSLLVSPDPLSHSRRSLVSPHKQGRYRATFRSGCLPRQSDAPRTRQVQRLTAGYLVELLKYGYRLVLTLWQ